MLGNLPHHHRSSIVNFSGWGRRGEQSEHVKHAERSWVVGIGPNSRRYFVARWEKNEKNKSYGIPEPIYSNWIGDQKLLISRQTTVRKAFPHMTLVVPSEAGKENGVR